MRRSTTATSNDPATWIVWVTLMMSLLSDSVSALEVASGSLRISIDKSGSYVLAVGEMEPIDGATLSVFIGGKIHSVANGGLDCAAPMGTRGGDKFGSFTGVEIRCNTQNDVPATFTWNAYEPAKESASGRVVMTLTLPEGANGTSAAGKFDLKNVAPPPFAPFPAWQIGKALSSAAFLCYGGDKSHLFSSHAPSAGGTGILGAQKSCFSLGNGPGTVVWPTENGDGGAQALVVGPASAFHLNYNTLDTGGPATAIAPANTTWSFGVSGDVVSVPAGFRQSTMLVHSTRGPVVAWDDWGATIRSVYNTTKRADEDIFLAALTLWTDNGAATLGAAWGPAPGTQPPPFDKTSAPGGVVPPNCEYMNWNWSMVSTDVLGRVADSVKGTGVWPRGTQLDCWWYPVQTKGPKPASDHPFWCVSDWALPEVFYPGKQGGLRTRQGLPQMMYFPALCVENVFNAAGKYNWTQTATTGGFVLPVAKDSKRFWGDMFDYGAALASQGVDPSSPTWPGVWVPPMVEAGWKGVNLAAYETDFYHNIMAETPQFRQKFGAGELFLRGIDQACEERGMTAQLCAGNPPSFLTALTMPSVTNARASIDYDWDGAPSENTGPRSNNGVHNWAAPDNSWVFRATRIAPSKDNFWTSWRDLKADGGSQDSQRNGKDSEMHAVIALLLTGPVGLGDTCVGDECMVNKTLVQRLARADGILLRPDLPLVPVDAMFGGLLGGKVRSMPRLCTVQQERSQNASNEACGARLWQTHATVWLEDKDTAPELASSPTRKMVSHAGTTATDYVNIEAALAAADGDFVLQHIVVSVDQPDSFALRPKDLYPQVTRATGFQFFVRDATDGGASCVAGTDAVSSGCVDHVVWADATAVGGGVVDVTTTNFRCSQPPYAGPPAGTPGYPAGPNCLHAFAIFQIWPVGEDQDFVLLGDLKRYVSLSGYRFRLPIGRNSSSVGECLVVVGLPEEVVDVTYLRRNGPSWIVHVQQVVVGPSGRTSVRLGKS